MNALDPEQRAALIRAYAVFGVDLLAEALPGDAPIDYVRAPEGGHRTYRGGQFMPIWARLPGAAPRALVLRRSRASVSQTPFGRVGANVLADPRKNPYAVDSAELFRFRSAFDVAPARLRGRFASLTPQGREAVLRRLAEITWRKRDSLRRPGPISVDDLADAMNVSRPAEDEWFEDRRLTGHGEPVPDAVAPDGP